MLGGGSLCLVQFPFSPIFKAIYASSTVTTHSRIVPDILSQRFSQEEAIRILAKAGYDAYDISLFSMLRDDDIFNSDDYLDYVNKLKAVAEECGIVCNQAHAPFPSSKADDSYNQTVFGRIIRSMEIAATLGAKQIVVHPVQHLPYAQNAHTLKEWNKQFYGTLIPLAERLGIRIATENMWHVRQLYNALDPYDNPITESTCSSPEEFCEYVDMMDSRWLTACLDIGHVPLIGGNLPTMIKALGKHRLQALHVHDNDWKNDLHHFPYTHRINFNEVTDALREIGYEGDLTFEANNSFRLLPEELYFPAMQYLCAIGRHLAAQIEGKTA